MSKTIWGVILSMALLFATGCNLMEKSQVEKMQKMAAQIDQLNDDLKQKEESYRKILTQYGLKGDQELTEEQWEMLALTDEQRRMLQDRLIQEKDSSYGTMIQEVLDMDQEIKDLRGEIDLLREQLPKPVVVQSGDNHFDLSMSFLMDQKGLSAEEAQRLTERSNLLEYLLPGFEVWLFYDGGVFGTFVTQGTAEQSPNQIKRYYKTKLINERDKARQEATDLSTEVDGLEARKAELLGQLTELESMRDMLNQQVNQLTNQNTQLTEQNSDKERRLNSIFFHIGSYKQLKQDGIVGRVLLGKPQLKNFNAVKFNNTMDLRDSDAMNITAEQAGLEKINRIYVMPRSFVKDVDYKIDYGPDGSSAVMYIVNPEKFRMSRVLLAVR